MRSFAEQPCKVALISILDRRLNGPESRVRRYEDDIRHVVQAHPKQVQTSEVNKPTNFKDMLLTKMNIEEQYTLTSKNCSEYNGNPDAWCLDTDRATPIYDVFQCDVDN